MKIAIINQPLANRGDESAHKAFIRSLAEKLPNDQIDVVLLENNQSLVDSIKVDCKNVKYIRISRGNQFYRFQMYSFLLHCVNLSLIYPCLRKFYNQLKRYDKVICAPGGICLGGFISWNHLWQLTMAKKLKKPIFYWGRSIGPFTEENYLRKVFKTESYKLLNYFSYISLRDSKSDKLANELGIKHDVVVDSAFLNNVSAELPQSIVSQIGNSDFIVFVPNELTWHYRYRQVNKEKIDGFYLHILRKIKEIRPSNKIVMLPQTYGSNINDYTYFNYLKSKYNDDNIIVIDETQSSDIQQVLISKAKLVIGARYHSIVFSINNETPFVALSYEHKIKGLLEKLDLTANMLEIQDMFDDGNDEEYNKVIEKFDSLIENDIRNDTKLSMAKKIVNEGFSHLLQEIELNEK